MKKDMDFARKLLEIRILTDCVCDGWNKNNIEIYQKIMFLINEYGACSPSLLISKIGIKKSNLALACKTLISQNKIEKISSNSDHRQVYYKLTETGEREIDDILQNIRKMFREDEISKQDYKHLEQVSNLLNKKI